MPLRAKVKTDRVKLSVPFYHQASQFTCGPASLMMVMKFFRPSIRLNRELEFDIWREANLVESYGTSKEGLALAAARRGFFVFTMGKSRKHSFVDTISDKLPGMDNQVLELLYKGTRRKFTAMHLTNFNRRIKLEEMKALLQNSQIPVLLTSTSLFGEKEDLPHWIVPIGYSPGNWYVNNPLAESPATRISEAKLGEALGYQGVECAVVVRGAKRTLTAHA
jgi:hypothetical protein